MLDFIEMTSKKLDQKFGKKDARYLNLRQRFLIKVMLFILISILLVVIFKIVSILSSLLILSSNLIYKSLINDALVFLVEYLLLLYLAYLFLGFIRSFRVNNLRIFKDTYKSHLLSNKVWPMLEKISIAILVIISLVLILLVIVAGISLGIFLNIFIRGNLIASGILLSVGLFFISSLSFYYIYRYIRDLRPLKSIFIIISSLLLILGLGFFFFETLSYKLKTSFPVNIHLVEKTLEYNDVKDIKVNSKIEYKESADEKVYVHIYHYDTYDLEVITNQVSGNLKLDIKLINNEKTIKDIFKLIVEGLFKKSIYNIDDLKGFKVVVYT